MTIPQAFDLAVKRHQTGHLAEAEAIYRQILAVQPNHAGALHLLGLVAHQLGRHDLAVDLIRRSIVLKPNNPIAHSNLSEAFRAIGQCDEAVASCRRALQFEPALPDAHNNLGNAFKDLGRLDEAIASYRRALEFESDMPEAHNNLGNALKELGQLDEAIAAYRRALELRADFPEAQNNLGAALAAQGQFDEAMASLRRALELKSDLPEAHNNLGNALRDLGQLDKAIAAYRHALELKPDYPEASNNLGNALKDSGQLDDAIEAYRRALRPQRGNPGFHSNLVYTLHFHPGYNARAIAEERRRWNRQFSEPLKRFILPHANDRSPERRLRIGYVSPDFREHVVGRNLIPLLERHDRTRFEILCYSAVVRPDKLTDEFRRHVREWRGTVGVADEALAEMIRRDRVDILVDLTQHLAHNRLPMFARKPAPIQVSFAGYPESTGLEAIEYRISDRYLEGGAADKEFETKEQVCLIDSFWCYDPSGADVEVGGPPAREYGRVTFGCLNNFCKINERVLSLWAGVLRKVKDSRLVLLSGGGSHRQRTLNALERNGIEADRVEFVKARPRREYLELYHRLDIVLDTFPYNGHTTSLDALWMGVPVVSLSGDTAVSRAGLSQLTNLGLPDLVAHSETEYVAIAESLARDLPRLAQLRETLRDRMKTSVLMDAPRFTRQVEQAYREMWRKWRNGPSLVPK